MASTETRTPYAHAKRLADRIQELLSPHCDQFAIAGSVRRECETIGDIEVVCLPKVEVVHLNLFQPDAVRSTDYVAALSKIGTNIKGDIAGGRYVQRLIKRPICDMKLDVFMPEPHDFWRQLAIRTGSRDYSSKIAQAWVAKGWRGTADGLRRDSECFKVGDTWHCKIRTPTKPPEWKSEQEFFEWLGMPWIEPRNR